MNKLIKENMEYNRRFTEEKISNLADNEIFVFGSNLDGFHAGGAARIAVEKFGAVWGQGVGLQGKCYAIPTMQGGVETIKPYTDEFIEFAKANPKMVFWLLELVVVLQVSEMKKLHLCSKRLLIWKM